MKGLKVTGLPPTVDAEILLKRMIIPKEGGKLIPETFTALKRLNQNGIITCGLTNNFVPPLPFRNFDTPTSFALLPVVVANDVCIQIIEKDSEYLPLADLSAQLLPYFTHFIESAILGIRKPNPEIFKHALKIMGLEPGEVVFLDDIGSNLKAAQKLGIRCIKVRIGREAEAVRELEEVMGMRLTDEKARL